MTANSARQKRILDLPSNENIKNTAIIPRTFTPKKFGFRYTCSTSPLLVRNKMERKLSIVQFIDLNRVVSNIIIYSKKRTPSPNNNSASLFIKHS